jgi:hypothetical protein
MTTATTSEPGQHVGAGPLDVEIPAGWHTRRGLPNPGGDFALLYMSPVSMPSPCRATGSGEGVCTPWPIFRLAKGEIVAAVRLHAMPGSRPPPGGTPTTVAGLPARRISGPSDEACSAIGGSQSIAIVLPALPGTHAWMSIDACLAVPDPAAADDEFASIVALTRIADGPPPSSGS